MEEERAAYEELSEQLGYYIGLVSGQRGPGSCSTLPRIQVRVSNAGLGSVSRTYHLSAVSRHQPGHE